jgi:hypothetical protein
VQCTQGSNYWLANKFLEQDVSLLVDVCRQSIVFREGRDLVTCFGAIANDPSVSIVRVKNRLDLGYNSVGGYRDVCINLRIVTEETSEMNVDYHVCEIQLILLPFAAIKVSLLLYSELCFSTWCTTSNHKCLTPAILQNDEGHKKYVAFRNLRGE